VLEDLRNRTDELSQMISHEKEKRAQAVEAADEAAAE